MFTISSLARTNHCWICLSAAKISRYYSKHAPAFAELLGTGNVLTSDLESYNEDWLRSTRGHSQVVLFPKSTFHVSSVLKYCNLHNVKCVVQSGNTSLVGGSVPIDNEVIISMKKMNQIISLDEYSGVLQCESGCVLQTLEEFVAEKNRTIPYDLGSKGSCLIGGNLATNAGGLRFVKYGPLHGNVLGIEVVLPNGNVVDLMSSMRKDNTGYHLRHLFIGSEGTLGVITKVSILCPIKLKSKILALVSLDSFDSVLRFFREVQTEFGEYLSTFEMIDESSLETVVQHCNMPLPFAKAHPFYIMFELSTNDEKYLENRILQFLVSMQEKFALLDGTYATDSDNQKYQKLRSYRELIPEGLVREGHVYKYDVSIPVHVHYEAVEMMRKRLENMNCIRVCGFGHIGDSNLHLNVTSKKFDKQIQDMIVPFIYDYVAKYNGSISAEHGVGQHKLPYLQYSKSTEAIDMMRQIKQLFDPNNIMNPNKMFKA